MSKTKIHFLIPFTAAVICGETTFYRNSHNVSQVTCPKCRKKLKEKTK